MPPEVALQAVACPGCGSQLSPNLLACPSCGSLVHKARLQLLAEEARAAEVRDDVALALDRWRHALELLPPETKQAQTIGQKVDALSKRTDALPHEQAKKSPMPKALASLGAIGLLLWKFKFVLVFLATKGKLLLLGLTKASTFFSMFFAFWVYLQLWGWKFALGLIATTYVHEIGHVAAMRRLGMKADAPTFIPGLGAFVRLRQRPQSPREDARIGLAGPIWGLAASAFCMGLGLWQDWPMWMAIGRWSALINLFNLLPVWQLDGARGFAALTTKQRWWATGAAAAAWFLTAEGLLVLLVAVCAFRAFKKDAPAEGDQIAFWTYLGLVGTLSALVAVHVPT